MTTEELILKFRHVKVLVIGDIMLDRFLWGSVSRISPEAPVPVVLVRKEEYYPGGAGNVARNLAPFCSKVSVLGRIGSDNDGEKLRQAMAECGIDLSMSLITPSLRTTTKTRIVARQQQIVRYDEESIRSLNAAEEDDFIARLEDLGKYDVVIVQDYAKGLLSQRLVDAIANRAKESSILLIADPNPRNPLVWTGFDAVKPNLEEAISLSGHENLNENGEPITDEDLHKVAGTLLEKWNVDRLLITLGERGMAHFNSAGDAFHIKAKAQQIYDVSGAGDTAIAFYALSLAAGLDDSYSVRVANSASGVVVAKLGTAFVHLDDFQGMNLD